MAVVTLEAEHRMENSAEVSDPELFMHILTASRGDCSHSCMNISICIYSTWIKIFDFMNVNKYTHTRCLLNELLSHVAMQLPEPLDTFQTSLRSHWKTQRMS